MPHWQSMQPEHSSTLHSNTYEENPSSTGMAYFSFNFCYFPQVKFSRCPIAG
jgi:hypothetical protein